MDSRTLHAFCNAPGTVQIHNGPCGSKRTKEEHKMELPLASWLEWVVAGGSVVISGAVLKVLDLVQK
jgi:hypothetical protein